MFALRLVLTGHTGTPHANELDYLGQAESVFEIKKLKTQKVKGKPAAKKPATVEARVKKEKTEQKAA